MSKDQTTYIPQHHTDRWGNTYTTVSHDSYGVREYILKNGLTVRLAKHDEAPRIQTYIAVRAGSNQDPADCTGLAHYLEHMMFKGNSRLGTSSWEKESPLLKEIANLYEQHRNTSDEAQKKEIYREIDRLSHEASAYAIPSEYDKLLTGLGAMNTNAHTWLDETVYKNNIPANELGRWLRIEKERFSGIALRLFHTELETVYEEFNRAQDNDGRLVNQVLMENLFPTHPNGQQTTIGRAEHLKNPSMKAIQRYYETWYVPNNMVLVLVGDLDFDTAICEIMQTFGTLEPRPLPLTDFPTEQPILQPVVRTVSSPTVARVQLAWRTEGYGSRQAMLADVVAQLCSNRAEAGLIDTELNQKQKTLFAQAYAIGFKQYGYFSAVIVPREDQSLEEGRQQILSILAQIGAGNFPDWMLEAVVLDLRLQRIKAWDTANGLATTLYDSFIKNRDWADDLREIGTYETITKAEVQQFAAECLADNYVAVEKIRGENEQLIRVENPGITPIQLKRDGESDFAKEISNISTADIKPVFVDFEQALQRHAVGDRKFYFVENLHNELCEIHIIFSVGTDHYPLLGLAAQYLQYLGTTTKTAAAVRQEFYRLGFADEFSAAGEEMRITLKGPEDNADAALHLLFDWINDAQADTEAYEKLVQTILESREAAKLDKNRIFTALKNYAQYGADSRFRDVLSTDELLQVNPQDLVDLMRSLKQLPAELFFYGRQYQQIEKILANLLAEVSHNLPKPKEYPEPPTGGQAFYVPYDMVQVELGQVARGTPVDPDTFAAVNVFNEYFGRGLSSIVFQEVREKRSLAYAAYISYAANAKKGHHDYIQSFIGTQPDKLHQAADTLQELLTDLPRIDIQFENARQNALKKIASTRLTRTQLYFNWRNLQKLGISYDYRKKVYEMISQMSWQDLTDFHAEHLAGATYNTAIIGPPQQLNSEMLGRWGEVHQLSVEELFGY